MAVEWRSRLRPLDGHGLLDDEVELGSVSGVFGVQGEVRLLLHHRDSDLLARGREVALIAPDGARFGARIRSRSGAGQRVVARIDGIDVRELAAEMSGLRIAIPRRALPAPDEGEYYLDEVVGMAVFEAGRRVGTVVDVHTTGPVEVFELDGERYLPSTASHIERIARAAREIHIVEGALAV